MFPKLEINIGGIIENVNKMKEICKIHDINLSLVTKVLAVDKKIVKAIVDSGIECICESRIKNLKEYVDIKTQKWLIREPMLSEITDVIRYSDVSLNSEIITIKELDKEASRQNKIHKVILMYELGDLREGANLEELEKIIEESMHLKNIELYGIGCNLSCYGSIMPDNENMTELEKTVQYLEEKFNMKFKVISGGNSTSFEMLEAGNLPSRINNLRIGEAIFLGNIPCIDKPIESFKKDNFILKAQIVEIKEKPSAPRGKKGLCNSFCEVTEFVDKGIRKRALIALGKQDININGLNPIDTDIEVIGGSSDYTILDITDSKNSYTIGDIISFNVNYPILLKAMESKYICKSYI